MLKCLTSDQKQEQSVFEAFKIEENFFDVYVSVTTIDHLLKIVDLLNLGETSRAKKKFIKLHPDLKNALNKRITVLEKSKTDTDWNSLCAEAINDWITHKAMVATENHKLEEAVIIFSRLCKSK